MAVVTTKPPPQLHPSATSHHNSAPSSYDAVLFFSTIFFFCSLIFRNRRENYPSSMCSKHHRYYFVGVIWLKIVIIAPFVLPVLASFSPFPSYYDIKARPRGSSRPFQCAHPAAVRHLHVIYTNDFRSKYSIVTFLLLILLD